MISWDLALSPNCQGWKEVSQPGGKDTKIVPNRGGRIVGLFCWVRGWKITLCLPHSGSFPQWYSSKHSRLGRVGGRWAEVWWGRMPRWRWTGWPPASSGSPTASCPRGFPKWCHSEVEHTCQQDFKKVQWLQSLPNSPFVWSYGNCWLGWLEPGKLIKCKFHEREKIPLEVEYGVLVVPKDSSSVVDVLESHKSLRKYVSKVVLIWIIPFLGATSALVHIAASPSPFNRRHIKCWSNELFLVAT